MDYDLTEDPGSQKIREYVAKLLGWERGSYPLWHLPGGFVWIKPLPDFLHDSAWTGPLLEKMWEFDSECHLEHGLEKKPTYYVCKEYAMKPNVDICKANNINTALVLAIEIIKRGTKNER